MADGMGQIYNKQSYNSCPLSATTENQEKEQQSSGITNMRFSTKKYCRKYYYVFSFKPYFFNLTASLFRIRKNEKDIVIV